MYSLCISLIRISFVLLYSAICSRLLCVSYFGLVVSAK